MTERVRTRVPAGTFLGGYASRRSFVRGASRTYGRVLTIHGRVFRRAVRVRVFGRQRRSNSAKGQNLKTLRRGNRRVESFVRETNRSLNDSVTSPRQNNFDRNFDPTRSSEEPRVRTRVPAGTFLGGYAALSGETTYDHERGRYRLRAKRDLPVGLATQARVTGRSRLAGKRYLPVGPFANASPTFVRGAARVRIRPTRRR